MPDNMQRIRSLCSLFGRVFFGMVVVWSVGLFSLLLCWYRSEDWFSSPQGHGFFDDFVVRSYQQHAYIVGFVDSLRGFGHVSSFQLLAMTMYT